MSIEALLERIAVAAEATHELLRVYGVPTGPAPATQAAPPVEPRKRGRPAKVETPAAPPAPPVDTGIDFGDAPSEGSFLDEDPVDAPAAVVYTREDVRSALVALQKKHGNPELARKVLKDAGGCDTLKSLDESKFTAVVEAAAKA